MVRSSPRRTTSRTMHLNEDSSDSVIREAIWALCSRAKLAGRSTSPKPALVLSDASAWAECCTELARSVHTTPLFPLSWTRKKIIFIIYFTFNQLNHLGLMQRWRALVVVSPATRSLCDASKSFGRFRSLDRGLYALAPTHTRRKEWRWRSEGGWGRSATFMLGIGLVGLAATPEDKEDVPQPSTTVPAQGRVKRVAVIGTLPLWVVGEAPRAAI